jgi:tetratricopeptide (TPR) repeat protein
MLVRLIATAGRADLGGRSPLGEELLAERPPVEIEVAGLFHLGFALHEEGRVEEAEAVVERARRRAQELTHSGLDVPLAWWRAAVALDHDHPDARRLADEALALHLGRSFYYGTELQTLHAILHREPGTRVSDAIIAGARRGLHAERALVAWSLAVDGHLDLAADVIGEAPPAHAVDYSIEASLCLQLETSAALGRLDEVEELLARIDRYTFPLAVYGTVMHLGAFDHFRAVGHRALGDRRRALTLARAAVETNRRCDLRPALRRSEQLVAKLVEELAADGVQAEEQAAPK